MPGSINLSNSLTFFVVEEAESLQYMKILEDCLFDCEGWRQVFKWLSRGVVVEMFCDQGAMHKYLFLFILFFLMAFRAGAQEKKLCVRVGKRVVTAPVVLINDEGGSSSTSGLRGSFNSGREPQNAGAQAAEQPEEFELTEPNEPGGVNSQLLPSGDRGGLQVSVPIETTAAGSSETGRTGSCSIGIDRPTADSLPASPSYWARLLQLCNCNDLLRQRRSADVEAAQPQQEDEPGARLIDSDCPAENPEAATPPGTMVATGICGVVAWLQDASPDAQSREQGAPVYQIPESRLGEFSRLMVGLLGMSRDEQVRTLRPVVRMGSYIFDSVVNPRWIHGRWIVPFVGLSTLGVGGSGLALDNGGVISAGFAMALLFTPIAIWITSHTPLENEYEVSFSFNWGSYEVTWAQVTYLEQIVRILRRTVQNDGDYNLIASTFSRVSQNQVLTFRVRTIRSVTEEGLRALFESQNQGCNDRFEINVSKYTADQTTRPANDG